MFQLCKMYCNYVLYTVIPISAYYTTIYLYLYIYIYTHREKEQERGISSATWKHNTKECNTRTLLAIESISWELPLRPIALNMKNAI